MLSTSSNRVSVLLNLRLEPLAIWLVVLVLENLLRSNNLVLISNHLKVPQKIAVLAKRIALAALGGWCCKRILENQDFTHLCLQE